MIEFDVEIVESDMSSSDENLFNEGIHTLENSEIEHVGALMVQVRRQFCGITHFHKP